MYSVGPGRRRMETMRAGNQPTKETTPEEDRDEIDVPAFIRKKIK